MNDYNEQEKCTDDTCPYCKLKSELISEFGEMVASNVHWENALRHVLDVAFTKDDELLSDALDESYALGIQNGILYGIEKSTSALDALLESTEAKFEEQEENFSDEITFEETIEAEEDDNDKIQNIIKKNL